MQVTITFKKLQSLEELELWDLEEPTFVELHGTKNRLLKNISAPGSDLAALDYARAHDEDLLGRLWGIRRFTACKGGSVWGDPHIYTLDGDKFDLYENGTYTIFQYSGQKLVQPKHGDVQRWTGSSTPTTAAHYGRCRACCWRTVPWDASARHWS